jgi:hypothetical protein
MTLRVSRRTESTAARAPRESDTKQTVAPQCGRDRRKLTIHHQFQVGKHLVSPLTRRSECGQHVAAAVSIRSGRGSMTHDRVLRFVPVFESHVEAARFAVEQALAWIDASAPRADSSLTPES